LYSESHTNFNSAASIFYRFLSFLIFLMEKKNSYIPSALHVNFVLL